MVRTIPAIAAACVLLCGLAEAGEWTPISETNAVTPSENYPGVMAAVAYVGPSPDQFLPYFAVINSKVCGGKRINPIAAAVGPTSLNLVRGPRVASVTRCVGDTAVTSPETLSGIRLVSGYFITGRIEIMSSDGKSQAVFRTDDVMKYLVGVKTSKQKRGI